LPAVEGSLFPFCRQELVLGRFNHITLLMRLWRTRRHWNRLARRDPFWAVLTAPDKQSNRWQIGEFFATGARSVDAEIAQVLAQYPALRRGAALDFGCGVGRLTQALARHFDKVTGVDISEEMLSLARKFNSAGDRVRFLHNARADLRLFADNQFDFVYSMITLQHMEPVYARAYIGEFVRVCAPGGAIFFQVPAQRPIYAPLERFRFSLWPPTVWKRINRIARQRMEHWFPRDPVIEMYALTQEEVATLLRAAGADVIRSDRYDATGATLPSYAYLARKP